MARHSPSGKVPLYGIGALLSGSARAFSRVLQARLAPQRVTIGQWSHLRTLWEEDGLTQVELCRRIGIQKASSTSVLNGLVRRALVRRVRDAHDRRKFRIYLTPAGYALRRKLTAIVVAVNREARAGLSEAEMIAFFRIGRAIGRNLAGSGRR
jgi:DNA-binding MarR family transcriptional regulator